MCVEAEHNYRQRLYERYVSGRDKPLAPSNLEGLRPRLPYFRRILRRHFPANRDAAILELGCGHGAFLHVMQEAGYWAARGVDWASEQVAAARRLGISGVEQADVTSALAATPTASLDVVVAFDLIEHLSKPELINLVDEVHRVLRPHGRWILHVPNGESPFGSLIRYGDFTHELGFTRQSLTQLLRASGFATVECHEDEPVPHGVKSAARLVMWKLIRAGLLLYIAVETGAIDRRAVFSQNLLAVARRS